MLRLVLLRHGEAEGNRERRFLGLTDTPLTQAGETQAAEAAQRIPAVEHVYVSPLRRCRQTAGLVWPGVEQTVVEGLRETDFGPFEGKTHAELKDEPLYRQWLADPENPALDGLVERETDCARRAEQALRTVLQDAAAGGCSRVGVVSHGGTLMSLLNRCGRPAWPYYDWRMDNCGGWLVRWEDGSKQLTVEGRI